MSERHALYEQPLPPAKTEANGLRDVRDAAERHIRDKFGATATDLMYRAGITLSATGERFAWCRCAFRV